MITSGIDLAWGFSLGVTLILPGGFSLGATSKGGVDLAWGF